MGYQTWIANNLRALGAPVEEYAGWTTRGSSSFTPGGVLAHWTAGPCGATGRPSLSTVVNGRSDLPGPLANVYLDRQGVAVVVAAGRANHAGDGGWRGLSGNSSVLGVEAECCNAGDWTAAQYQQYPVVLAALVSGIGRDASWVARHCDWTSRKIDINDWPLAQLQASVAAVLAGGAGGAPTLEDDMPLFVKDPSGAIFLVSGSLVAMIGNLDDLGALQAAARDPSKIAAVSKGTVDAILGASTSRSD